MLSAVLWEALQCRKLIAIISSMLATLEDCRLRLPATFKEYAQHGIEATFFTPLGEIRIYFVACCNMCVVENASAEVWKDFDMMNIKPDRLPSAMVGFEPKTYGAVERRRKPCYERRNTSDPVCASRFDDFLCRVPPSSFRIEPTSHERLLIEYERWPAMGAFPEKVPKKAWISPYVFLLIKQRGYPKRLHNNGGVRIENSAVWACFQVWSWRQWRCKWTAHFGFVQMWVVRQRSIAWNQTLWLGRHIMASIGMKHAAFFDERLAISDSAFLSDDPHRSSKETKCF